jgi:hypothetical protein
MRPPGAPRTTLFAALTQGHQSTDPLIPGVPRTTLIVALTQGDPPGAPRTTLFVALTQGDPLVSLALL